MPYQALLVVLSLWSITAALPAQVVSEIEPNNTPAQAQPIPTGWEVDCRTSAGDVDWFAFSLGAASNVAMFLSSAAALDTRMELYESTGTILLAFNDDARDLLSDITINLNPGNYLLKIVGSGVVGTVDYTLDLAARPSKPFTGAEVEPNDVQSQAYVLPASFCRESIQASLASSSDQDWYRLTLSAPRSGVWVLISEGDSPSCTQHRYELLDLNGPVDASTLGPNAGNTTAKSSRSDQLSCWPAGTYFIVVKNRSPQLSSPTMTWPSNYRLTIEVVPMNTGGAVSEIPERNDQLSTVIAPGERGVGSLLGAGNDVDYWGPFSAGNYATVIVQTKPGTVSPLLDSTLRLVDARGMPLQTSKGTDMPASLTGNLLDGNAHARLWAVVDPGAFWIEVTGGAGPSNTGNYELEVGLVPCAPVSAANMKRSDNATCPGSASGVTVLLSTPNPWELPVMGSTYVREVRFMLPNTPGLLIQDFTEMTPIDLSLVGLTPPGCFLSVNALVLSGFTSDGLGAAPLFLSIPVTPALIGATVFGQVLALDPFVLNNFTLSNTFGFAIGEQSY